MKKLFLATAVAATALLSSCNEGAPKANLKTDIDTLSYEIGMASSPGKQLGAYLTQVGSDSTYEDEFLKGMRDGLLAADDKKKMAYYQGVQAGLQTKMQMFKGLERQIFGNDSTKELSAKNYLAGFSAAIKNKTALKVDGKLIDQQKAVELATARIEKLTKAAFEQQYAAQKKQAEAFMAGVAKQPGIKSAGDGVYYKVIKEGTGALPTPQQTVVVKYEGKLPDGKVFDSSDMHKKGEPAEFLLQNVVKGWSTALVKMPVGSIWEIYIPYNLGYGEQGNGAIPPFSPLVFKVELLGVK